MKKLLAIVLACSGCVSPMIQVKKDLGPQASEYMSCPEAKLDFEDLQQVMVMVTRVRVSGCGKESFWMFEESRWKKDNAPRK
ncbi:MAG: hypothetical protein QM817_08445 [Archangium sp.]